jgi:hypothetical protein
MVVGLDRLSVADAHQLIEANLGATFVHMVGILDRIRHTAALFVALRHQFYWARPSPLRLWYPGDPPSM